MPLDAFLAPRADYAYRHIPADARYNVLDFSRAGIASNNRWNVTGEPTLYLAGDRGVAIAEFSRHIARDRPSAVIAGVLQRQLYRLHLNLECVLDLCHPGAWEMLALKNPPHCFLDRSVARAVARYVRVTTTATAMRVPSMAFLDDLDRWVMVVFLEKLPSDARQFIAECQRDDVFSVRA